MSNIVTYKFKYKADSMDVISDYIHRFNNLLRCTYTYIFKEKANKTEAYNFQKDLNNITVECGLRNGAIYKSNELIEQQKEVFETVNKNRKQKKLKQRKHLRTCLFGGKKLYTRYLKGLIDKEEFEKERNFPLCSVGESNQKANRHFRIKDLQTIVFQPTRNIHIDLKINVCNHWKNDLQKLHELQELEAIPITYQLDYEHVYVTFDLEKVREKQTHVYKENRVFAVDLNPNYVGYTIVDWIDETNYKVIAAEVVSMEELNEYDNSLKGKGYSSQSKKRKYVSNKRNHEICNIVKYLVNQAKHYKCQIFAYEDLKFKQDKSDRSKKFNRLCRNQWNYAKMVEQIIKRCKLENIFYQKILPEYSSFIGNLVYRKEQLPDMCLASLEIGRRAYEYNLQHVKKVKDKKRNIIFPDVNPIKIQIIQALEEIGYLGEIDTWVKLYNQIKKSKIRYRFPLTSPEGMVFSFLSTKSSINLYKFIHVCT